MDQQNQIKKIRLARGISQEDLAKKTGLNIRTIQRIENNETSPHGDSLKKIFDVLNSSPELSLEKDKSGFMKIISNLDRYWEIFVVMYVICLVLFFVGIVVSLPFISQFTYLISYIFIVLLIVSVAKLFKKKQWKKGVLVSLILITTIIISGITIYILGGYGSKLVIEDNINGKKVIIERHLKSGKTDTIFVGENN